MQITRQADYALRTVLHLSRLAQDERASTSQIAREQRIPSSFLAKIISQLTIAGFLQTARGARGGVSMACSPSDVTMLQVIEAIDGPIWLNLCLSDPENCPFGDDCPIRSVWCEVQAALIERLKKTTFGDLLTIPHASPIQTRGS